MGRLSFCVKPLLCALFCLVGRAYATEVALVGVFPGKAVLVVDGGAPHTIGVGQTLSGVKLVSVDRESAVVDVDGRRSKVMVGERPVALASAEGKSVLLQADARGHFLANGAINGAAVQFMVDTGATSVAMGPSAATRAGIVYTQGTPGAASTANGVTRTWQVKLDTVTIGDITLRNVDATVMSQEMPVVLLGMSFLKRMEMKQENSTMLLKQRY
ncbi:retropepsin-like aspartic protease family protein [Uliginosibacterium gangwonense]|uniref:retropepsin-like aspartic protease family protein n=1 Tax=Uliginosibacterium gangwonense TaxID=392736 RepID=UPI00039B3E9C|nr:TIGR02281 family clan AA aspartic protease [Uliginosibacterium gangwonense]